MHEKMNLVLLLVLVLLQVFPTSSQQLSRIYFGSPMNMSYPWLASLKIHTGCKTWRKCAGTLVAQKWVLTAAHCVKNSPCTSNKRRVQPRQDFITAYFGSTKLYSGWTSKSSKIITHGLYAPHVKASPANEFDHDIALIKLSKPVPKHRFFPVRVIGRTSYSINRTAIVVGWGRTETSDKPRELQSGFIRLVHPDKCWAFVSNNPDKKLCANINALNDTSICMGDSGGPLLLPIENNELIQIGISSYLASTSTHLCGMVNVFTDLSHYIKWIEEIINSN